jgi:hypothetical protein
MCHSATRNPITIRVATNMVLMISDLDVIFSTLFLYQLSILDGIYLYFLAVVGVGILTYVAGLVFFAPGQKFRTIKLVREMMVQNPEEFRCEKKGHTGTLVGPNTPLTPAPQGAQGGTRMRSSDFASCQLDAEGIEAFKTGLCNYGLLHMWNAAEMKNAKNCCERKHGIPFFRLARFGFMSSPTPKDLSGILNANALYTFCTGLLQISFGIMMMHEFGPSLNVILPLSVSGVSLLLSVANVLLDFSSILTEIEAEQRLADQIRNRSAGELATRKKDLIERRDEESNAVQKEFGTRTDAPGMVEKQQRLQGVNNRYEISLQQLESNNLNQLRLELDNYRNRLEQIKEIMSGRRKVHTDTKLPAVDAWQEALRPFENQIDKINEHMGQKLDQLDPTAMAAEDYDQQVREIQDDGGKKVKIARDAMEAITKNHAQGP